MVQIGDQELVCSEKTKGAIKYVGDMKGCFCSCNGEGWMAMSQSKNCSSVCKERKNPILEDSCGSTIGTCLNGRKVENFKKLPTSATWYCMKGSKSRQCSTICPWGMVLE